MSQSQRSVLFSCPAFRLGARAGCGDPMYQSCTFVKAFSSGLHGDYVKWGRGTGMNSSAAASTSPARLVLVRVRGFGQVHAERITRLSNQGLVELVAAVDPGG